MERQTKPFDAAAYLTDDETIFAYLTDAFEYDDAQGIVQAIDDVARARAGGMLALAVKAGLGEEELQSLRGDAKSASIATILKLVHALDVRLEVSRAVATPEPVAA